MQAYLLEMLVGNVWRRQGDQAYWSLELAERESKRLIRTKRAQRVRVLPAVVGESAVAEFPKSEVTA
ncbi:MAG: hypothetical protein CMJ50_01115 [Planctomycetaceae bacterium]|nr:hypothetical protein [Planctomycetaceae bacterium]